MRHGGYYETIYSLLCYLLQTVNEKNALSFYAFAAAALAAVSMNGQIYLCGNWDNDLGWNPANPLEFTQNADGNWEYADLHIQSFKISTVKAITGATVTNDEGEEVVVSDWDQFNGGALGFEGEFTKDMVGTPIELTAWGENLNLPRHKGQI